MIRVSWKVLRETRPKEIALRFLVGGAVTAAIGWIGHHFGPVVGGVFLAFPSILPAGLTLEEEHEGSRRAAEEARGAVAGALGLVPFALVVRFCPPAWSPALVLPLAAAAWFLSAIAIWRVVLAR
jgi:hypothetical protein